MGSTASSEASGFDATALTVHGAPAPTTYGSASRYYSPPVGLERALGLARQGKWSLVQAAMGGGPVNEKDAGGDTLLHYAAQQGNAVVTAKLLNAGADPNMRNEAGYTPVRWAAASGNAETLTALISAGGDVNSVGDHGESVLIRLASEGIGEDVEQRLQVLLSVPTLDLEYRYLGKTAEQWARDLERPHLADLIHLEMARRTTGGADVDVKCDVKTPDGASGAPPPPPPLPSSHTATSRSGGAWAPSTSPVVLLGYGGSSGAAASASGGEAVGAPPVPVSAALTTTIAQLVDVSSAGQAEDLMARVLELLETVEGETALERSRWRSDLVGAGAGVRGRSPTLWSPLAAERMGAALRLLQGMEVD